MANKASGNKAQIRVQFPPSNPEGKRMFAMVHRDEVCTHPHGFSFSGNTPNTGLQKCRFCGGWLV